MWQDCWKGSLIRIQFFCLFRCKNLLGSNVNVFGNELEEMNVVYAIVPAIAMHGIVVVKDNAIRMKEL